MKYLILVVFIVIIWRIWKKRISDQTGDFCCEADHRVAGEGRE
jgi:hypothetical protein